MGQHCSEQTCKQLDFLPMKCDACSEVYCTDHLMYDLHNCSSKYKKDVQVPVCPLCNQPIPVSRGSLPDLAVSQHIEAGCSTKSKEKVFSNKCHKTKCKKKELVPLVCQACRLNFCLTHRHPADHECKGAQAKNAAALSAAEARSGKPAAERTVAAQKRITNFFSGGRPSEGGRPQPSPAAVAALNRQAGRGSTPGRPIVATGKGSNSVQPGNMTEDEALAAALAASMATEGGTSNGNGASSSGGQLSQEDEDRLLAQALEESERSARREGQSVTAGSGGSSGDKNCSLQ